MLGLVEHAHNRLDKDGRQCLRIHGYVKEGQTVSVMSRRSGAATLGRVCDW
jgi:hypothetical protein